jgi:protoheme IX farnesyltransferase
MRENGAMDYVRAAQPRIVALFAFTVFAAMLLAGGAGPAVIAAVVAATALVVAGAAILNNLLDRDVDRRMERTRRRPTATGRIGPRSAAAVGLGATVAGALALWSVAGGLAALLALCGAAYYVVVYTLVLKPRSALSSIPGGLAGVFPVLVGWAATGTPAGAPLLFVCALIVVWSPPHFWALALAREEDYRASGVPTPVARYGAAATRRLVAGFVAALAALTLAPAASGVFSRLYLAVALLAALALCLLTLRLLVRRTQAAAWTLFKASGPFLAAVLAAAVADRLL